VKNLVLDSFAVLAYLQEEKGAAEVRSMLTKAKSGEVGLFLSAVNLGEIAYITERSAGLTKVHSVLTVLQALPLNIVDVNQEIALRAAHFKATFPIAYADCFALALADHLGGCVVTGDPEFEKAEKQVQVYWLPRKEASKNPDRSKKQS